MSLDAEEPRNRSFLRVSPRWGLDEAGGAVRGGEDIRKRGVREEVDSGAGEQVQRNACCRAGGREDRLFVAWVAYIAALTEKVVCAMMIFACCV